MPPTPEAEAGHSLLLEAIAEIPARTLAGITAQLRLVLRFASVGDANIYAEAALRNAIAAQLRVVDAPPAAS